MTIGFIMLSKTIPAGEFKAKCLHLMDEVQEQHVAFVITKRGKPVAKLVPIEHDNTAKNFGCMKGTVIIHDDIISPIGVKWDANE